MLALVVLLIASSVSGQTLAPPTSKPVAPGLIKLTGDDEKRAKQLDEQIDKALKADRWDEAIAKTDDVLALRAKVQGPKHFETVLTKWRLKALRRVAPMSKVDRAAYLSAVAMDVQAEALNAQGKYAEAEPLYEKALQIRRRLLADDHASTASTYNEVAANLYYQGKFAQAQPLCEKARRNPAPPAHRRPPEHCPQLQQPGVHPQRPGEVRPGSAILSRRCARDPAPPAHRRPPRHRHKLQRRGVQPQPPGKVCRGAATLREGA